MLRTFWAAKKVAAATAHEAAAAAHPPPTQRPPLGRSHGMETVEPEAPPQRDEAERGMDAGVARGDGAHLLEVNEGVDAALPACSGASCVDPLLRRSRLHDVGERGNLCRPREYEKVRPGRNKLDPAGE